MAWSFDPALPTDKDKVRLYIGDTDETNPQVADETIDATLVEYPDPLLAAAVISRSLAAQYGRQVTYRAGDVSENSSDLAKFYLDLAKELDPAGVTKAIPLASISVGGLSISEKETLDSNSDAVQPSFSRGMDDIPGGPSDGARTDYDEYGKR